MSRLGLGALRGGSLEDRARRIVRTLAPAVLILLFQMVAFPIPAGVAFRGVLVGLLTAMVSVGMALVYRANRILNFAQADLGYIPASLSVMIVITSGLPWLVAFGAGFAVAVALGAACELLIIRRFFRAPRLVLTVATIGLTQLLAVGGLFLPRAFGEKVRSQRLDPPFDFTFRIDPLVFNANDLLVLVIAPIAILGIGLFLQRTSVGVAIRAAADRADRASLLGVPVKNLHTIVWAIAGMLAFLALFLRAGMIGLPIGSALSLDFLVRALAALIIGRMTHLPTITGAAIALGVLEMGVDWNGVFDQKSPLLIPPIIFLVAVVSLLLQRKDVSRYETDAVSSWTAADEVRPVPSELRRFPEVRARSRGRPRPAGVRRDPVPAALGGDRHVPEDLRDLHLHPRRGVGHRHHRLGRAGVAVPGRVHGRRVPRWPRAPRTTGGSTSCWPSRWPGSPGWSRPCWSACPLSV